MRTLLLALLLAAGGAQAGCGPDPEPCKIEGGFYHAERPEEPNGAALAMLHGWNGSAEGMLGQRGFIDPALRRGYTLILPAGQQMSERPGRSWAFHPDRESGRDDGAFLAAAADDAAGRFELDRERMLLSGFSVGGSMAAHLACDTPGAFAAYAPVGGNLWQPYPEGCAGPAAMLHTHGWRDGTVPLEGRMLGGSAIRQGDVFEAIRIWRTTNLCPDLQADGFDTAGGFWRRRWSGCAAPLELALFDGGHRIPDGWAEMALDWFEGIE